VPLFEGMGVAGLLNLAANYLCLRLLATYRDGDVNLASAWECARNDIFEGFAVIAAAALVWIFGSNGNRRVGCTRTLRLHTATELTTHCHHG
jgi:Co/Zn/Cd efflux system component